MIKRVLVVSKYHFLHGGAERYFLGILEALARRGIEAVPLSVDYPGSQPTPHRRYFVPPVVPGEDFKLAQQAPTPGQKLQIAARAVYSTAAAKAVRRIARDLRPDVAYLLNINNHLSPSVIDACARAGIPVVMRLSDFNLVCASNMYFRAGRPCTDCKAGLHHAVRHRCVHGSLSRSAAAALAIRFHRWLGVYDKVDAFVAPTHFMARELEELGFGDRTHQINTFVAPRPPAEPDHEEPHVLFAGRLVAPKGPDLALQAFARCRLEGSLSLHFLGDQGDADARRLRNAVQAAGLRNVRILPFEPDRSRLFAAIQRSLFTLAPAKFYENLPNAILESFACGRPVIATRLGSLPEIVHEGENGLLFQPDDAEDLAAKIEFLARHDAERERMGRSALALVQRDYSEDDHCDALVSLFDDAVKRAGLRRATR